MNKQDFLSHRREVLYDYRDQNAESLEYHEVNTGGTSGGGSAINTSFQFYENDVRDPVTRATSLPFRHRKRRRSKRKKPNEAVFTTETVCDVFIPTQALVNKGITLKRDNSFLRFPDGKDYTILSMTEQEPQHGTSLEIKLVCKQRTPERCGNDDSELRPEQ